MLVVPFKINDDYCIQGEFQWFGVILHSTVKSPWSGSLRHRFRMDLREIASCVSLPLYAFQTEGHDPKKRKFIKSVGGVFSHFHFTGDNERAEMFRFFPLD